MSGADISVINLSKFFYNPGVEPVEVLHGLSFDVKAGESLAVTGPSGSGKSTLLQILGALDVPTSGDVLINGRNIVRLNELERTDFRNREMGFVFQAHYLLPQLSVLDNILVPAWNHRKESEKHIERAHALLDRVGLKDFADRLPGQLSGGERQRVAVARALLMEPSLLLADEPTGALDHKNAESLVELLLELNKTERTTLLMVTHSTFCAAQMGRQIEIIDGNIKDV